MTSLFSKLSIRSFIRAARRSCDDERFSSGDVCVFMFFVFGTVLSSKFLWRYETPKFFRFADLLMDDGADIVRHRPE